MSSTSREAAEPPLNPGRPTAVDARGRVAGPQNRSIGAAAADRNIEAEAAPIGGSVRVLLGALLTRSSPRWRIDIGADQVKQPQLMTT